MTMKLLMGLFCRNPFVGLTNARIDVNKLNMTFSFITLYFEGSFFFLTKFKAQFNNFQDTCPSCVIFSFQCADYYIVDTHTIEPNRHKNTSGWIHLVQTPLEIMLRWEWVDGGVQKRPVFSPNAFKTSVLHTNSPKYQLKIIVFRPLDV